MNHLFEWNSISINERRSFWTLEERKRTIVGEKKREEDEAKRSRTLPLFRNFVAVRLAVNWKNLRIFWIENLFYTRSVRE